MQPGEVRWYNFKTPNKKRPGLIVTRTSILGMVDEVTIAPITSKIRQIPGEVILSVEDGVPKVCAINLDHGQTVAKAKIGPCLTALSDDQMERVKHALLFALGF